MAQIVWGVAGTHTYETGVDRGVLFPPNAAPGVAWNGLSAVNEAPSGGDPQAYYLDGVKYLQIASAEEFNATIEAFSAPAEFGPCDGTSNIFAGLFLTQQPRKQFGFAYRTIKGNDVEGNEHGYKIHLVYNALAKPSSRNYQTLGTSSDPVGLSWDLTTVPPALTYAKPTAHLVISSLDTVPLHLQMIEDILYGTDTSAPRLPSPTELIGIFAGSTLTITDNGDGTFTATGSDTDVNNPTPDTYLLWQENVTDNGDGTFSVPIGVNIG